MKFRASLAGLVAKALVAASLGALLSGCEDSDGRIARSTQPIPSNTLALMEQAGSSRTAPVLIRTYKKEAELEIWKMKADGRYTLLKTFPMCRWSGQLGPKRREGDRQVPEGFYPITPGQMNPNSSYYLSFNVGYPNAYDRVHEHGGGSIMVHGACSSAGCFSMTDEQIAEIYAIAREGFAGGQRAIQMQSYPFRMTAENLAKHRADPNIAFWKELKEGSDHFDVSKQEPLVNVCNRHYKFNASPVDPGASVSADSVCPPLKQDENLKAEVSAKAARDDARVAELVSAGTQAVKVVYADGGQHPSFASRTLDVSRPDALAAGPTEIALNDKGKPKLPLVQVAVARAVPAGAAPAVPVIAAPVMAGPVMGGPAPVIAAAAEEPALVAVAAIPAPPARPVMLKGSAGAAIAMARKAGGQAVEPARALDGKAGTGAPVEPAAAVASTVQPRSDKATPFYKRWLGLEEEEAAPGEPLQVNAPSPVNVPLPPHRAVQSVPVKPQASLAPGVSPYGGLPQIIVGAQDVLPSDLMAYAPGMGN